MALPTKPRLYKTGLQVEIAAIAKIQKLAMICFKDILFLL